MLVSSGLLKLHLEPPIQRKSYQATAGAGAGILTDVLTVPQGKIWKLLYGMFYVAKTTMTVTILSIVKANATRFYLFNRTPAAAGFYALPVSNSGNVTDMELQNWNNLYLEDNESIRVGVALTAGETITVRGYLWIQEFEK